MAEATRFKDLQEALKRLENLIQTESLKWEATDTKIQESIQGVTSRVDEQLSGVIGKLDHVTNTLANLQMQIMNLDRGKSKMDEGSILGGPTYGSNSMGMLAQTQEMPRMRQIQDYNGPVVHAPLPRLDFPRFDGSNLRVWILKCNSFFKLISNVSDAHKVTLASMHFDGRAALWYQNHSQKQIELSWAQFLEVLTARFEDLRESRVIDEFNKLKQTGSYADYVDKFEELKACMSLINGEEFSENYFVASFISGLNDELQSAISMFEPKSLQHAINLGKKQVLTIDAITKKLKTAPRNFNNFNQSFKKSETIGASQGKQQLSGAKPPIKILTAAEMAARRDKGLCYNCDEPYSYGHKCKQKISYMIMSEEEEGTPNDMQMVVPNQEKDCGASMEEIQLTLNAIKGEANVTTMRLFGEFNQQRLHILIDTGSTLSFIQEATAKRLRCPLTPTDPLLVRVGNGQRLVCAKQVDSFCWKMQGHEFNYALRALEHEGCDLILGGDWLKSCTPIELDYDNMTFTVTVLGKKIKLQAITSNEECRLISEINLFELCHQDFLKEVEEIYLVTPVSSEEEIDSGVQELLDRFKDLFEEPVGLPPERGVEHQILLKPGSVPKQ